jgi:MscS family membrane protein
MKVLVAVIASIISLRYIFNLNNTSILSTLGFTAVAVGLALKETIENFFGSFTLLLDKPFIVGDTIRFNGMEGTVEKVGFRSTKIRTLDKSLISVPNKQLVEGQPDNISGRTSRRHEISFYLSVNSKSDAVKKLLENIERLMRSHALIQIEKSPYLRSISLDGIEIWIAFTVETTDSKIFNAAKEEIHLAILRFIEQEQLQLNERH